MYAQAEIIKFRQMDFVVKTRGSTRLDLVPFKRTSLLRMLHLITDYMNFLTFK